ncbi:MAG: nitronate monooxygenase [Sphingomonadales bacterium]|nr:nitronate monooxygenase [Sphingomonadales bacterium]
MSLPASLKDNLALPLVAAPMFLVSGPKLVTATCKAGVLGTFPSLNARPIEQLDTWLDDINKDLTEHKTNNPDSKTAPYGVNLIVHPTNERLLEDVALVQKHKVPVVITSVGHPGKVVEAVHSYGGLVFHDVINMRHAQKAIEAGVDGVILVCAGAGGHAGLMNPFTFVPQVRDMFDGTILLAGTLSNGRAIKAAQVLGADLAYMGTRFIATAEALADDGYKTMLGEAQSKDIIYTDKVSGIMANFMQGSLESAGIDISDTSDKKKFKFAPEDERKAWKHVWSAGQGVGEINDSPSVGDLIARLKSEYDAA